MKKKLAKLLIFSLLMQSVYFGCPSLDCLIEPLTVQAAQKVLATPSASDKENPKIKDAVKSHDVNIATKSELHKDDYTETEDEEIFILKPATPSQVVLNFDSVNGIQIKGESGELILNQEEIYYGETVGFQLSGIEFDGLSFEAFLDDNSLESVKLSTRRVTNTGTIIYGILDTSNLGGGDWRIIATNDVGDTGEAFIRVKPGEYKVTFVEKLTKEIGEEDPANISLRYIQITDKDNHQVYRTLGNIIIEREAGEKAGNYKITGITAKDRHAIYYVEENEFSYLTIEKHKYTNGSGRFYLDGNRENEITFDLIKHMNDEGKNSIPQDIIKPMIKIGKLDKIVERNLAAQPEIKNGKITIRVAPEITQHNLTIPLIISSDNYEDISFSVYVMVDYVKEPTQDQIKSYYKSHPFNYYKSISYEEQPGISPYRAGKVSEESLLDGLNALNFVRYIAGLPAVEIDKELSYYAQAGCVLLAKHNGELNHHPSQPSGMPDDFYEDGYQGTSSSNLSYRLMSLSANVITGYMDDGDASNIDSVGHRRWCLNPQMGKTGFGYYRGYGAMYAFDDSAEDSYTAGYVPWPARQTPYEYFLGPWSVQFDRNSYASLDEDVSVVMTTSSGKTYAFNSDHADGYFNIDTGGYGDSTAVIFKPTASIKRNEKVNVHITGLHRPDGTEAEVQYDVEFFSMAGTGGSSSGGSSSGGGGGGGGGSSSGGGGGGGSSTGASGGTVLGGPGSVGTLPDYVITGTWNIDSAGQWSFVSSSGEQYRNKWAAVYNPYANTALGQQPYDWFRFDENGIMVVGWFADPLDGRIYYLNPVSDNTKGRMLTGWQTIAGREYYFNPNSDGTRGRLLMNERTGDGHFVGADGVKVY